MIVRVRFFASLREAVGLEQEGVTIPEEADVPTLLRILAEKHPLLGAQLQARAIRVAVNRCYVSPDTMLKEGDEVALVPPVGGG